MPSAGANDVLQAPKTCCSIHSCVQCMKKACVDAAVPTLLMTYGLAQPTDAISVSALLTTSATGS